MTRRAAAAIVAALALCTPLGPAGAQGDPVAADDGVLDSAAETHGHQQHDGSQGHLPASSANVEVVGRGPINQDGKAGRVADVSVFGDYAYLGAYWEPNCQKGGVYVFDISDPALPKQINFIRTSNDSYVGEGVQVVRIDTPAFTGDVLAMNNELCGKETQVGGNGGMTLVDVTDPKRHDYLVEHAGDDDDGDGIVNTIHSVFLWDAGDRAFAAQVDNEESADVDIFEITDPRNPVLVGEYDLAAQFPQILQPGVGLDEIWNHDLVVEEIGGRQIMVVSYWDAGYVLLDVTDPAAAAYVADSDFAFPDARSGQDPEGNAHQAEFSLDDEYLVAADEDFNPYKAHATTDDGADFTAVQGSDVPGVPTGGSITGDAVFVGRACPGDPAVPPAPTTTSGSQIAVVERGVCTFQEKLDAVAAAGGYDAILVFNRENGTTADGCETLISMLASGDLPAFFVTREDGFGFFDTAYDHAACEAGDGSATAPIALGAIGDRISLTSVFDGWGYVHLYENGSGKLTELDTYAVPQAHDPAFAEGFGDLSVHEIAMSGVDAGLGYVSYYAAGFRVLRIVDGELVEAGHFIDEGGNNIWGVEVFQRDGVEYVATSDRDFGLYILRYTGP